VLLPSGVRVLDKIERVLLDELASLQAQEIQLSPADFPSEPQPSRRFQNSAARGAHAAAASTLPSDAPYPTNLSRELPVLTELLSSEFGSAARGAYRVPLRKASLRTRIAHPAASAALSGAASASSAAAATSLWSAAKHTSDFISMHSSRRAGLECYQQTMDSFVRALSHIGLRQAMLLEASPHRVNASHGVDADLAHEVHVPVLSVAAQVAAANSAAGLAGSVLRCDQCSYAARRERAVSKLPSPSDAAATTPPTSTSASFVPDPLQRHLRLLVAQQLALHYPMHVVQQLGLSVDATHWRCELVIDRSGVETENEVATMTGEDTDNPAQQQQPLPLVYMVLLRRGDELNLTALSEHVGSLVPLEHVEGTAATLHVLASLLSEHPAQLDELRAALPPSQQAALGRALSSFSSSSLPLLRVDSRPELLIDQALLPLANIDLDLEAMLHTEAQQQLQQQQELQEHDPREHGEDTHPQADDEQAEDASESESPLHAAATAALHARMERSLLSSARSLGPGQSLDLVAVELAAQGKDVRAEQARLYAEGVEAQRQQHEAIEQEREQRRLQQEEAARRTAKALEEEEETGEATSVDLEADSVSHDASGTLQGVDPSLSSATSSSFSSSSSFGLSSSRQGSFRLAQPGEQCAMCNNGSNNHDHSSSAHGHDGKSKDSAAGGGGVLRAVRTAVLANGVFIGRQELVQSATTGRSSKMKKPKREFVHTSYARFSPLDTLALLAQQHLVSPSLLSAAQARGSSGADAAAVSLDTLTRLQWPALVAPFQCALLPVLSADAAPVAAGNLRDLHRARAARAASDPTEAAKTDERTWATAKQLHAQLMALSASTPTPSSPDAAAAAMTADLSSSLSSDVLLDDRTELPINARVQSLVASGVPILLLLQPRALAAGQVSLVLNRPGVSLAPRRVALEGLPKLLLQMLRAPHNPVLHARRKQRELDAQRKREEQEREQRAQQEEEELMQLQAEADEFQQ
jgi:hypothetical protein